MDREKLESWLKNRPREDAILIAQRAALRVFPLLASRMSKAEARSHFAKSTPVLRCYLTAGVARRYPAPEVRAAASLASAAASIDVAAAAAAASATDAAAPAFAAAFTAAASAKDVSWQQVKQDVSILQSGGDILFAPLWHSDPPATILQAEQTCLEALALEAGDPNSFWHRWYLAAKRGAWLDWDLQRDIALIPNPVWKEGPKAVLAAIAEIEVRHDSRRQDADLAKNLAKLPPPDKGAVAAVRQAMERNRDALPPTFDAILGLIALEIDRLLRRNYSDDLDQIECQRQIGIYLTLHDAICALRENLPASGPVSEGQAAKSESLLRLYADKFRQLPFAKADEVAEGTWEVAKGGVKAGLIGGSALLAMSYGLPAMAGVTIGTMIFAPKNAADLIKAAREALAPKP